MTYKNMVKGIVERKSTEWLSNFYVSDKLFGLSRNTELRIEQKDCFFECEVEVLGRQSIITEKYIVGGTIDENGRVYKSVIWNSDKKIVWASTKELRELENITTFEIS